MNYRRLTRSPVGARKQRDWNVDAERLWWFAG
jgi:hypothetical protein